MQKYEMHIYTGTEETKCLPPVCFTPVFYLLREASTRGIIHETAHTSHEKHDRTSSLEWRECTRTSFTMREYEKHMYTCT